MKKKKTVATILDSGGQCLDVIAYWVLQGSMGGGSLDSKMENAFGF